jgi:hypothetical protein
MKCCNLLTLKLERMTLNKLTQSHQNKNDIFSLVWEAREEKKRGDDTRDVKSN